MDSQSFAILTLAAYLAFAVWWALRGLWQCPDGWRIWVLYLIARFYTPAFFRQRLSPACPLPPDGAALILANHRSPLDPILIFSASFLKRGGRNIRRVEFLTAVEFCNIGGFIGWITEAMGVIPVERNGRDMGPVKEALRRLKDGRLVGIFPEGRINLEDRLLPGNPGMAWLALHGKVPVHPIYIHDAPTGNGMVEPFYTPSRVRVTIGPAVDLSEYEGRRINSDLLQEVTNVLMRRLAEVGGVESAEDEPQQGQPPRTLPAVVPASQAV